MLIQKRFTFQEVEEVVTKFLSVSSESLRKQYRGTSPFDRSWAKHLFVYCLYHYTGERIKDIAEFVRIHRSSINNTLEVVNHICQVDTQKRNQVIELEGFFE
jgi:hypothetical protein